MTQGNHDPQTPAECVVQLRYAPLPYIFGAIADHYWFVVFDEGSAACQRYHYWPGPNSNTFAAWVLREAGIEYPLHWRAVGSHYGKKW